jgi:hypothetical protein
MDRKPATKAGWLGKLQERRHKNVVIVGLANKIAVWALLRHDREYQADYSAA